MNLSRLRLLLIDDDEDEFINIRDLLKENREFAYEIAWQSSYERGLEALEKGQIDACLLDHRLGARTGLELLVEARRREIDLPIIFLTGFGDHQLDLEAMQTGASEYLVKSQLTAPLLERSIRYALKNHRDKKALRERERSFSTLLNSTFEGIVVHENGVVREVNAAAGEIFGLPASDLVGKEIWQFLRADFRKQLEGSLSQFRGRLEGMGLKADGSEIFLELLARTVSLNGKMQTVLAVQDLTERKQMEMQILQQDRLASLGLLASSLAHEIGTPLGVIRGRAEIADSKAGNNESLRQDLHIIVSQIDRIAKLVDSLLHLARAKQNELTVQTSILPVVLDVTNLVQHELVRKSIGLKVSVADNLMAKAESGLLGQVFLNLMINAIHAIEQKKKEGESQEHTIEISATENPERVEISITDTGCGISEKNLSQLFKPFFTTKDIGQGTGLGLATSFNIINSWSGNISVKSKVGQGTTFTVSLRKN